MDHCIITEPEPRKKGQAGKEPGLIPVENHLQVYINNRNQTRTIQSPAGKALTSPTRFPLQTRKHTPDPFLYKITIKQTSDPEIRSTIRSSKTKPEPYRCCSKRVQIQTTSQLNSYINQSPESEDLRFWGRVQK